MSQYRQQRREAAIDANDVGLHLIAIPDLPHVAHVNRRAVHRLDRHVVHRRNQLRAAVEPNQVFTRAHFHGARGKNQVLQVQRVGNVGGGQSFSVQRIWIQVHHHVADFPAVGKRHGDARYGGQPGANEILTIVVQFLLGKRAAAQTQLQNGNAGGVGTAQSEAGRFRAAWSEAASAIPPSPGRPQDPRWSLG